MIPDLIEIRNSLPSEKIEEIHKSVDYYLHCVNGEQVKQYFRSFFPLRKQNPAPKNITERIKMTSNALCFAEEGSFKSWFTGLSPYSQKVLYAVVFETYLPVSSLENGTSMENFFTGYDRYSWNKKVKMPSDWQLDFLEAFRHYERIILRASPLVKQAIRPWLIPPRGFSLRDCTVTAPAAPYSLDFMETGPLLNDSLCDRWPQMSDDAKTTALRGFKKAQVKEWEKSFKFTPFPIAGSFNLSPADLAARFFVLIGRFKVASFPVSKPDVLRTLVQNFFQEKERKHLPGTDYMDREFLEWSLLIDHLSRPKNYSYDDVLLPPSRRQFRTLIMEIDKGGKWYDTDLIIAHLKYNALHLDFRFLSFDCEHKLTMKGEKLIDGDTVYDGGWSQTFEADEWLRSLLLVGPLFKAYCYLFASLGLLDITEKEPPLGRVLNGNAKVISPYDALHLIRVNELGRYCLGLSSEPLNLGRKHYEAIADKELYLVTIQGESILLSSFLDTIGMRLGENRWRISPESFISNCSDDLQIIQRINKFHDLIDANPADHWGDLFENAVFRAQIFPNKVIKADVYDFSKREDRDRIGDLLEDPALRTVAHRAEGGFLIVEKKDQRKFQALLLKHGILFNGN
ncbi:hypothetical protein FACS1894200_07410 [Spirochaetia bacterium]|nr:hypothetical protein FACS1894200_07410 [Spirochaetia bacterium]